ncbi:unnamed protein product, partial [Amoebophrya sp. A25]
FRSSTEVPLNRKKPNGTSFFTSAPSSTAAVGGSAVVVGGDGSASATPAANGGTSDGTSQVPPGTTRSASQIGLFSASTDATSTSPLKTPQQPNQQMCSRMY